MSTGQAEREEENRVCAEEGKRRKWECGGVHLVIGLVEKPTGEFQRVGITATGFPTLIGWFNRNKLG
ncbi:hypothetical protein ATANTOWER_017009 [Ataeniobius toweri]|nr:hypothetical protein [Ataeniobius toweri]